MLTNFSLSFIYFFFFYQFFRLSMKSIKEIVGKFDPYVDRA